MSTETKGTVVRYGAKQIDLALSVGRKMKGKAAGSDLGNLENGPINELFLDPEVMAQVVWDCFDDALKELGFETFETFAEKLTGEFLHSVTNAVREAIIDFFPWGSAMVSQIDKRLEKLATTEPPDDLI